MNLNKRPHPSLASLSVLGFFLLINTGVLAEPVVHGIHSVVLSPIDNIQMLQDVARVADDTTQSANRFFSQLGFSTSREEKLTIKIYSDHQKMLQETPTNAAKEISMLGYFNHQNHEIGFWYSGNKEEMHRIIRHETIHHAVHEQFANLPVWLDEGLAEFLSRDPQALQTNRAQVLPMIMKSVLETAQTTKHLKSVDDLAKLANGNFYGAEQDIHYATSYAILAYLLNHQGERVLGNFISAVQGGAIPSIWIAEKTGVAPADFQKNLLAWAMDP